MRTEAERREWIAHCERVESYLSAALARLQSQMGQDDVAMVKEFLDNNELGLAIERLLTSAADNGLTVDDETGGLIDRAATAMDGEIGLWRLPLGPLVDRLTENGFT